MPEKYYGSLNEAVSVLDEQAKQERFNDEELNKVAAHLRHVMKQGTPSERRNALSAYSKLRELVGTNLAIIPRYTRPRPTVSPEIARGLPTFPRFKKGGLIPKGQKGLTMGEYAAKYGVTPIKEPKVGEPIETVTPKKGTYGTLRGASALDIASMGGMALSFVPGVGAIGGAITTGADLVKDLQDGQIDDWGTHLSNIGFTALGAIGLGGLRGITGVAKIGKALKGIDKSLDLGAASRKALKLAKVSGNAPEVQKVVSSVNKMKNASKTLQKGGKSFDDLVNNLKSGTTVSPSE